MKSRVIPWNLPKKFTKGTAVLVAMENYGAPIISEMPRKKQIETTIQFTLNSWKTTIWCGLQRDPLQIWRQGYLCSIWWHHTLQLLTGLLMHGFPESNIPEQDFNPNSKLNVVQRQLKNNNKLTRSSLFVKLLVSAFWLASSSRMRLCLDWEINKWDNNIRVNQMKITTSRGPQEKDCVFAYPLSRFKSKRCPAVTLSISYLSQTINKDIIVQSSGVEIKFASGGKILVYKTLRCGPQFTSHLLYITTKFFSLTLQQRKMMLLHHQS